VVKRRERERPPALLDVPLTVPGETVIPDLGSVIRAEVFDGGAEYLEAFRRAKTRREEVFDLEKVPMPLRVRFRRVGDRFRPLGMRGEKKLQDFFTDLKVGRAERDRIPLVASPRYPIWIVGYRIDDRVKVSARTKRLLRLSVTSL